MKGQDLSDQLGGGGGQQPPNPPQLSKEQIKDLDNINCDECGCEVFVTGLQLKFIPSVHPASPPGDSALQPVQALACANCGEKKSLEEDDVE
jgi:hypothetical protein